MANPDLATVSPASVVRVTAERRREGLGMDKVALSNRHDVTSGKGHYVAETPRTTRVARWYAALVSPDGGVVFRFS